MKNYIKKLGAVIAIGMLTVSVSACQAQKEMVMTTYTSGDNTFSVTLPEGMEQTDMLGSIMMLEAASGELNIAAIAVGEKKSAIENSGKDIHSLEEFGEYLESVGGFSAEWKTTSEKQLDGLDNCVLKEGAVKQAGTSSDVVMLLGESKRGYCGLMVMGGKKKLDSIKEKMTIASLAGTEKTTTVDFIDGMKAVLDSVNGVNLLESTYAIHQMYDNADETEKKSYQTAYNQVQKNSQAGLSESWSITDKASLFAQKDGLLTSGHNQEALSVLTEYGIEETMSREELTAKIEADGLTEEETTYVLAAYDARAAFGDSAIRAWDLSRIPTIMGMGYGAGYCTYAEALDACLEAAKLAQQSFDSWDAFNRSYMYGYSYWSEESLDDPDSSAYSRQELVKNLVEEENGPFSVDWNLELKKEWQ